MRSKISLFTVLLLCAVLLVGCARSEPKYSLKDGQVCFEDRLVLGIPMEEAPKSWELSFEAEYGGLRCSVELEADDEGCLRSVSYNPRGYITEEQLENLMCTMEKDYGLEFMTSINANGDEPPSIYTLAADEYRARIWVSGTDREGDFPVTMSVYRLPDVPGVQAEE